MSTANEILAAACTSGIACLDEMNLLRVIAQGANAGGGGGGGGGTLSTDGTFAANSDLLYPSQKAAKTYITTQITGLSSVYVAKAGDTMTGALLHPAGAVGAPSISFSGDTDTGIWSPGANIVALSTAGAERVRVDATGNVGIGEPNPLVRLQALASSPTRGIIQALVTTGGVGVQMQITQAGVDDWTFGQPAGVSAFAIWSSRATGSDGIERLRIDSSGNVGIGTTSPQEILSINGARAALYNTLVSSTNFERLDLEWSANVCRIWTEKGSGGGTARDLVIGTNATEAIRVLASNQSVGVGVSPTAVLHLKAGTATASTAPLKFNAGVLLTTPEIGAAEFTDDGTTAHFYITVRVATVVTRVQLA